MQISIVIFVHIHPLDYFLQVKLWIQICIRILQSLRSHHQNYPQQSYEFIQVHKNLTKLLPT